MPFPEPSTYKVIYTECNSAEVTFTQTDDDNNKSSHFSADVLIWVSPTTTKSDSETCMWEQVVYLGNNLRKH